MRTVIEPFRIKSVEELRFTTREEREGHPHAPTVLRHFTARFEMIQA